MADRIPLHIQKLAVSRAHELLEADYAARIERKQATRIQADRHLAALLAALATLDDLDTRRDFAGKEAKT